MNFAVLIPAYNEAATIVDVVTRALAISPLVIVVDDGSVDETASKLEGLPVHLIRHSANKGKAASLWDGIQLARQHPVDCIITLDGDGQHAPEDIPRLLAKFEQYPDHIIIGARLADKSSIPAKRYYANRIANFWLAWAAGYPLSDSQSGFRVYPAQLFESLKMPTSKQHSFVFESEILIKAARQGIYSTTVAIPAVYAENARASHFNGVRDITYITLMVARYLLSRGLYPQGLYRSLIKPKLLPEHEGRCDYAAYAMALLSLIVAVFSLGITLFVSFIYVCSTARKASIKAHGQHIVILGKRLQNNVPDTDYRLRLERALELFEDDHRRQFYLLGGKTGNADISESKAGELYLQNKGLKAEHIQLEQSSRNTLENMKQLQTHTQIPGNHIVLITNRYHLARATTMAKQFGYKLEACAAERMETKGIIPFLYYLYEAVSLHWYLTGLTYAKITRNPSMLARISK